MYAGLYAGTGLFARQYYCDRPIFHHWSPDGNWEHTDDQNESHVHSLGSLLVFCVPNMIP